MSGVGDPLQANVSTIVRVDKTDAVPVTVSAPEVIAGDIPTNAVAAEKTEFDETVLVAISATLMYLLDCAAVSLKVIAVAPAIAGQVVESVLVLLEQECH